MAEQLPLLFLLLALSALGSCSPAGSNNSTPAIFVFGDSTVDPGNNNFLPTLFKSNFPPYGKDYPQQRPTGRFTDGKLVTDFLASYMGLKDEIPPYLNPTLNEEELLTGVSFASAGSGYDPLTAKLGDVISIPNQLEYFKDYLNKRRLIIGENRTEDLIRRSVYVVSCGTNDFVNNYFALPVRRTSYSIQAYQLFVLQKLGDFLQGLRDLGARRIGLVALPPFGCLPIVRTLNPTNSSTKSGCIESLNSVAKDFNGKLQHFVASMKMNLGPTGGSFVYADIYQTLADIIYSPDQFGFVESRRGCCGTGYIEFSFLCNLKCEVCEDASKYVFWDAIHPTEKTYYLLFQAIRGAIDEFLMEQS
ncbi:GDSL esterase/lipase At5g45960 [Aristolochia californica]|uniref:GDSL esterase/lipase At5g45960 n=1 Tax=Aristolochia californica TaxID=171875 RepID=UPI0035D8583B